MQVAHRLGLLRRAGTSLKQMHATGASKPAAQHSRSQRGFSSSVPPPAATPSPAASSTAASSSSSSSSSRSSTMWLMLAGGAAAATVLVVQQRLLKGEAEAVAPQQQQDEEQPAAPGEARRDHGGIPYTPQMTPKAGIEGLLGVTPPERSLVVRSWDWAQIRRTIGLEDRVHIVARGPVKEVHACQFAANSPLEDRYQIVPQLQVARGMMLGVFDGHSGTECAEWCEKEMLELLEDMHFHQQREWEKNMFRFLLMKSPPLISAEAFVAADKQYIDLAIAAGRERELLAGACGVVSHIDGQKVTTANVGDCRAIIGRKNSSGVNAHEYEPIDLTKDHQLKTNPQERARLLKEHPNESDVVKNNRVKGYLEPTRAFGDAMYKRPGLQLNDKRWRERLSRGNWNPPYITAEPDITTHTLGRDDRFLVMATDGVFEGLTNKQVVTIVGEFVDSLAEDRNELFALPAGRVVRWANKDQLALLGYDEKYLEKVNANPPPLDRAAAASVSDVTVRTASSYVIEKALLARAQRSFPDRYRFANDPADKFKPDQYKAVPMTTSREFLSLILQNPKELNKKRRNLHDDLTVVVVIFDHNKFPKDTAGALESPMASIPLSALYVDPAGRSAARPFSFSQLLPPRAPASHLAVSAPEK